MDTEEQDLPGSQLSVFQRRRRCGMGHRIRDLQDVLKCLHSEQWEDPKSRLPGDSTLYYYWVLLGNPEKDLVFGSSHRAGQVLRGRLSLVFGPKLSKVPTPEIPATKNFISFLKRVAPLCRPNRCLARQLAAAAVPEDPNPADGGSRAPAA